MSPNLRNKLEALRERGPPWPRYIITPIFPNVIMLSLGGERLTPKVLDHYLHHDLGMLPLLPCLFAHLLILEYPDHHQTLISSLLYYPGPLHKIRQTNATKLSTSSINALQITLGITTG